MDVSERGSIDGRVGEEGARRAVVRSTRPALAVDARMVTLAVALVIGGAIAKFVSAFVDDVVMPLWGWMLPGGDWRNLRYVLPDGNAIWIGTLFASAMDLALVVVSAVLIARAFLRRMARRAAREG